MGGQHFLPLTQLERQEMLGAMGAKSVADLFQDIPGEILLQGPLALPPTLSETEVFQHLSSLAAKNKNTREYVSFLGAGVYDHFIPSVIRHIIGRTEFYTAYTPYQAEVSQGVLQSIFEYQTLICQLTGMEVTNASLYDGATALVEGAVMACGITRRSRVLLSRAVNPFYRQVLQSYFNGRSYKVEEIPLQSGKTDPDQLQHSLSEETAALIVQTPNFFGLLEDLQGVADLLHEQGGLLLVVADPLSLPIFKTPAEYDADIVVGEGQALGSPSSFGGPLLGFLATREKYLRKLPGRIVGETVDINGKRGFVLTLQTREQHIRRERATSNICTNQALNALAAAVYLVTLGPQGLREVAGLCLQKAAYAREKINSLAGYAEAFPGTYFKEFPVCIPGEAPALNKKLLQSRIIGGLDLSKFYPELQNTMLLCVTEKRTCAEIDLLVQELEAWR
ncbi:MAG: aminomethyl-transferring glycine dehydrogenase subunit GcvPA [Bacillota bacterium]